MRGCAFALLDDLRDLALPRCLGVLQVRLAGGALLEGFAADAVAVDLGRLEEGEGEGPDGTAIITVHQRCQLVNGTIIEDTYRENETSEVKMEELIEGYQEGIQLMKKGARYKFFIPWELAWGKNGTGSKIPPYSMLIFDVRLIDFW